MNVFSARTLKIVAAISAMLFAFVCLLFIPAIQNTVISLLENLPRNELDRDTMSVKLTVFAIQVIYMLAATNICLFYIAKKQEQTKRYIFAFSFILLSAFLLVLITLVIDPSNSQTQLFRFDFLGGLYLWDMFICLEILSETTSYTNAAYIYPPLAYLLLIPLIRIGNYQSPILDEEVGDIVLQNHATPEIFVAVVAVGIMLIVLYRVICALCDHFHLGGGSALPAAIVCSSIIFFSIATGNLIILSAALICFFVAFYNSDNKQKRIFAIIALAVAATLKIYPAIFGLLYITNKQYKEAIYAATLTLFLFFAPFLCIEGGFDNVPRMYQNLKAIVDQTDGFYLAIHIIFGIKKIAPYYDIATVKLISSVATYALVVLSMALAIVNKSSFIRLLLITCAMMFVSYVTWFYILLYLIPSVIVFFATLEERKPIFNLFVFSVFVLVFCPFQYNFITLGIYDRDINIPLASRLVFLLWIIAIAIAAKQQISGLIRAEKFRRKSD